MKRFITAQQINEMVYHDIDIFYKHYSTGYLYSVFSYRFYHDGRNRLERLLARNRYNIQDYIYIQPHGIFSSPEKLGDWFETFLHQYDDKITSIWFRTNLEISTEKKYNFNIIPMKLDIGDTGPSICHYDGLKFDTFPPAGCPMFDSNGEIIGHTPEIDENLK